MSNRLPKERVIKPLRDLLQLLLQLQTDKVGHLDLTHTPAPVLSKLIEHAEDCASTLHRGISAIGSLLAHSSAEIEDGTISSDTVEALGWLLAELGDFGAACFTLAAQSRKAKAAKANMPRELVNASSAEKKPSSGS